MPDLPELRLEQVLVTSAGVGRCPAPAIESL